MKLVVHGNCQSGAIQFLLGTILPAWSVSVIMVHNSPLTDAARAAYAEALAAADAVLYQPVSEGFRGVDFLSSAFVEAHARPGAAMLRYPSIFYAGYMQGYAILRDAKGHLRAYGNTDPLLPMVDAILAGDADAPILARLMDPGLIAPTAVERFHRQSIAELHRRECRAEVHLPVSPFLAEHRATAKALHTYNHPYRHVLADLVNRALRLLSVQATLAPDGPDPLAFIRMPSLPAVARSFRETDAEAAYLADGEALARAEFFARALHSLRAVPVARLEELYAPHRADWQAMAA